MVLSGIKRLTAVACDRRP